MWCGTCFGEEHVNGSFGESHKLRNKFNTARGQDIKYNACTIFMIDSFWRSQHQISNCIVSSLITFGNSKIQELLNYTPLVYLQSPCVNKL